MSISQCLSRTLIPAVPATSATAATKAIPFRPASSTRKTWFPSFPAAHLLSDISIHHGDFRDALTKDGYTIVKGAIPRKRALECRDRAHEWMEGLGFGYKRGHEETYVNEKLPAHIKGGMIHGYGIGHEQWVWDVRTEPGIVDAFAKVWEDDKLITSFDGVSIMLPNRMDIWDDQKWEHVDQSPRRAGFYCVQGLANLCENGSADGGLMVLKGSSQLFETYFDEIGTEEIRTWGPIKWFLARGCDWVKVEAEPGNLILWDGRTIHYNVRPRGSRDRVCTYVCQAPDNFLSEEDKRLRREAFEAYRGTTHVPFASICTREHIPSIRLETGQPCPRDNGVPSSPRAVTERVAKLAGLLDY